MDQDEPVARSPLTAFLLAACLALTVLAAGIDTAATTASVSERFGEPGTPVIDVFAAPEGLASANGAGEPSMGISWKSDDPMMIAGTRFHWASFNDQPDDDGALTEPPAYVWEDRTPGNAAPTNVDPMLHTDEKIGRVWAGGLSGPTSVMFYSDDDGLSWQGPIQPFSGGGGIDHQTIGSGPWPSGGNPGPVGNAAYGVYYCAQTGIINCARSTDGGQAWIGVAQASVGGCSGLHGHLRIAPDGTVYLPIKNCGFARSTDAGDSWVPVTVPGYDKKGTWDPSIGISRNSGVIYFGNTQGDGPPHVAVSKDRGLTWEGDLGTGDGQAGTQWLDLGAYVGVKRAVFPDLQAGDDGRAAYGFLGSTFDGTSKSCGTASNAHEWHYYLAFTYDFGRSWEVQKVTDHPVQMGGIWDGGGGEVCRNLLDFNDMDIDSQGRVYAVFADGCLDGCTSPGQSRDKHLTLLRQRTGCGLFAEQDLPGTPDGCPPPESPQGPTAGFTCEGDHLLGTVSFTDGSTAGDAPIASRSWDFGDGSQAPVDDPSFIHAYEPGTYLVNLTVTDAGGLQGWKEADCTLAANNAPVIQDPGDQEGQQGTMLTVAAPAVDPDGDGVTYVLDPGPLPPGARFDAWTGTLEWRLGEPGTYGPIRILATDGRLWAETVFQIHVQGTGAAAPTGSPSDADNDGAPDLPDECPGTQGTCGDEHPSGPAWTQDTPDPDPDNDGSRDADEDNCAGLTNPDQQDVDYDGTGDACDPDLDGDGVPQIATLPSVIDNCPMVPNGGQTDTDGDGLGDLCDHATGARFAATGQDAAPRRDAPMTPSALASAGRTDGAGFAAVLSIGILAGIGLAVAAARWSRVDED